MRGRFRIYASVFALTWKRATDYRFDFLFGLGCGLIPVLATIMLWEAVFSDRDVVGGYTFPGMVSYVLFARFLGIILLPTFVFDVQGEIQQGDLTSYLSKPVSYIGYWLFRTSGEKSRNILIAAIPIALAAVFLRGVISVSLSLPGILLFALSALLAYLLYFMLFMMLSLASFWFYDVSTWYYTLTLLVEVLAGSLVPLSLFPPLLRDVVAFLPFGYLINFPITILIGSVDMSQIIVGVLVQLLWGALLFALLVFVWCRGVRRYEANGG